MIKNFKKNNSGFTLIELIVVMIIIGILVLLATPRFVRYIEEARYTRIINDIRVVETVSVPEMVKNNMEFPKGTEEEETDLSTFAQEKRAYMKDGIIAAKGISSQFIPEVGNISEFGPDDIRTGYHKLDKKGFIKPETKTRLKGDFYINKEGYVVYVDGKAAKGENIVEEEFIDRTELFLYDDEGGNPGTIIGMNFDHEYFEGNKNKAEVEFLYGFNRYERENKKKENLFPDKTYVLPQIPDVRIMNGKTIPVTKIESIMTNANIVLKIEELIFGDNMREIGEDAFKCTKEIHDPGDSRPYHYNLIAAKEEADLDMNQVKTIDEGAFEYIIFTGSFDTKNLTAIKAKAFKNSKFTGSFDTRNLTAIGGSAFENSKFTGSFDTKNLTSIGSYAFRNSKFDGTFTVREKMRSIFEYAFYNSEFTGSFDSKNSLYTISESAFENSKFDGTFTAGKKLGSIGIDAFRNSKFTGSFDPNNIYVIGMRAFKNSEFTGSFDSKKIKDIGSDAFENSKFDGTFTARDILGADIIKGVGDNAFKNSKFTGTFNPNRMNSIGNSAFENSRFTGSFNSKNLRSIGKNAFYNSEFDGRFTAEDELGYINEGVFYKSKFTGDFDSNNVWGVDKNAFYNSKFDGTFIAGDKLEKIYENAFYNSEFTGSFDSNNITEIRGNVFYNSKFDGTFIAGDKLERIYWNAFYKSKFTGSFNGKNLRSISDHVFYNSEFTGRLDTGGIRSISDYAFENSTFDSIKLGKSLGSLGTTPFGNTENTSVGSEVKDGKLHSMVLPELEYLDAHSLTGLKIEGTLDIPKIRKIGYSNRSPAGFASCNFTNIILPERLSEEKKQEFKDAVENDLYWAVPR